MSAYGSEGQEEIVFADESEWMDEYSDEEHEDDE